MKELLFCILLAIATADKININNVVKAGSFQAGVAKVDGTLPVGTPLAGYNHGARRVPFWPLPVPRRYTTWMEPSTGARNPTWLKALVIDNGVERICFVTLDGVGSDGTIADLAYLKAVELGFTVKRENVIVSASHSHSGPGAISPEFLWEFAPATDLIVPELQQMFSSKMAEAMVTAQKNMVPALIDIGMGNLTGVTNNRRAPNPWLRKDTIDPHLGVIRVDTMDGKPLATLWNYAIHGVCYGPDNMQFSSDIMGAVCDVIENEVGGVALFVNSDAGDVDPIPEVLCGRNQNGDCSFNGAPIMAKAVQMVRNSLTPTNNVDIRVASKIIPFGLTKLNITLQRFNNCSQGGPLDICTICTILDCDANLELADSWVEEFPRFTALRFDLNNKKIGMVTIPGEALVELGWWIRNVTQDLGYDQTFLLGYSNNHMGYFATPNEYDWGGYESQLTFWGIGTAAKIRDGCQTVAEMIRP